MSELAWIDAALTSARPQAVGALLRYFRQLDRAEEAFQEACLRALKSWPKNGPPRDPAAWLILVGRNAAIDDVRRGARHTALPDEDKISDLDDVETPLAERLDGADYRDDILRLLFVCCHEGLPDTQQIALALRIVSERLQPVTAKPRRDDRRRSRAARQGRAPCASRPLSGAGRHRRAARPRAADTDWQEIALLYASLERLQPSPVVTLNRAVGVSKTAGAAPALALIEPLAEPLDGYFHFHGLKGALLLQLGCADAARRSFDRAIALAGSPAEAAHIRQHLDRLSAAE